jgi:cytochrome d ubiquinol oxidase subunit II
MDLQVIWFVIIAIFWTGFFVLEGFDFGVGALHTVVGKNENERRVAINSIGPFWDANEVWLIVGASAIFAAFPSWYATMFSAQYLVMLLILVALIMRGVSFEWRGRGKTQRWRNSWSGTLTVGSVLAPLLLGVGLGDLLTGLPINAEEQFTGTFWNLLTPYGLLTGALLLLLCIVHGATFMGMKTTGDVRLLSRLIASRLSYVGFVVALSWAAWTHYLGSRSALAIFFSIFAVLPILYISPALTSGREGRAFAASAISIGSSVAMIFASLYPNVMVSSTDAANNLTVASTASGDYALGVITVVAVVLIPIVLLYQGWNYWVFRNRVSAPSMAPPQQDEKTSA